jgi:FKBP-type peptidyl-prolyl cis-trans isomerase
VQFHFVGRLPNGQVFVNSWSTEPAPISFVLGSGKLLKGLDQQLRGLVAGDRARILLGSNQAFGATGDRTASVPPNTPVAYLVDIFEVT